MRVGGLKAIAFAVTSKVNQLFQKASNEIAFCQLSLLQKISFYFFTCSHILKAILDFEIILSMQKRCQVNYTGSCSLNLHNLQVLAFCVPLDASVYCRGIGRDNSKKKKKYSLCVCLRAVPQLYQVSGRMSIFNFHLCHERNLLVLAVTQNTTIAVFWCNCSQNVNSCG